MMIINVPLIIIMIFLNSKHIQLFTTLLFCEDVNLKQKLGNTQKFSQLADLLDSPPPPTKKNNEVLHGRLNSGFIFSLFHVPLYQGQK